jgi:hypothetical protein
MTGSQQGQGSWGQMARISFRVCVPILAIAAATIIIVEADSLQWRLVFPRAGGGMAMGRVFVRSETGGSGS